MKWCMKQGQALVDPRTGLVVAREGECVDAKHNAVQTHQNISAIADEVEDDYQDAAGKSWPDYDRETPAEPKPFKPFPHATPPIGKVDES